MAESSLKSPAKPGIAGIKIMTLNFLPSLPALTHASTIAAPMVF
jgi:hypothetical protein